MSRAEPKPSQQAPRAPRLLLVADVDGGADHRAADAVERALIAHGFVVERARRLDPSLAVAPSGAVALVELRPGERAGLAVMEALHRSWPQLPVIMLAAQPSVGEAVRAMQAGAESYLPMAPGPELIRAVRRALQRAWPRPCTAGDRRAAPLATAGGLVGETPAIRAVLRQVALVAPTRTTVLLLGETGTGKERLAQAIHDASPRRHGPFVAVNCAALSESLLESELFGHEKGAFSGAHCRREGRFEAAHGGTIFLDEIGEISPAVQVKLLRVLQERRIERVGGNESHPVDVRIIAATNRDLRQMVEQRSFRADLFYRLNVMAIAVPPLRERRADIPLLVEQILPRLALELGLPEPTVTPEVLEALRSYPWPGNVRELENVLERAVVLAEGGEIGSVDLPALESQRAPSPAPVVPGASFREVERHVIMTTYEACGRSPVRTAEVLGISPRTVHYRLREYRGERGRRRARPGGRGIEVVYAADVDVDVDLGSPRHRDGRS